MTVVISLITTTVASSCHGFGGNPLIVNFLTVAEVAAPVASCPWKPSPPNPCRTFLHNRFPPSYLFLFPALNPNRHRKGVYGRLITDFFSCLHLTLFFHRYRKGPSKMPQFPLVLPNKNCHLHPLSSVLPHTGEYLLLSSGQVSVAWDTYLSGTQQENSLSFQSCQLCQPSLQPDKLKDPEPKVVHLPHP